MRPLAMAALQALATCATAHAAPCASSNLSTAFPPTDGGLATSEVVPSLGLFGMDAVLADLTGDARPELILSGGGVSSPQPLVVYENSGKKKPFSKTSRPSWYSESFQHYGTLAVADVDSNGWADVVAPVLFDRKDGGTGWVELFPNGPGGLAESPRVLELFAGPERQLPLSVALGDADGDGDADLAVSGVDRWPDPQTGFAAVYLNERGSFSRERAWLTREAGGPTVLFADLDGDGWLDLVVGGRKVVVFVGSRTGFVPGARPRALTLEGPLHVAYGVAVVPNAASGASIAVADHCRTEACEGGPYALWLYRPGKNRLPSTRGERLIELENGAQVAAFEAGGDGCVDLVVTQLGPGERGAPAMVFAGTERGFDVAARLTTAPLPATGIATGAVSWDGVDAGYAATVSGSIVTLPHLNITRVRAVRVDGKPAAHSWAPMTHWLSVASDGGRHAVAVDYEWSPTVALVLVSHNPAVGPQIVYSDFPQQPEARSK